jgi:hypothetical protein
MGIGTIHEDADIVVKMIALLGDCKEICHINKLQRGNPRYVMSSLDYKIDSMEQLTMELEREINPKNLEGDDV